MEPLLIHVILTYTTLFLSRDRIQLPNLYRLIRCGIVQMCSACEALLVTFTSRVHRLLAAFLFPEGSFVALF